MELIEEDIQVAHARRIVIKPNLTSLTRQLASTHVEAIRAVLDFLGERMSAEFIIAEGVGDSSAGTCDGFDRFGYCHLAEKHNVRFVDLNADAGVAVDILDFRLKPFKVKVAQTMVNADYLVSVCPPKTHDHVGQEWVQLGGECKIMFLCLITRVPHGARARRNKGTSSSYSAT